MLINADTSSSERLLMVVWSSVLKTVPEAIRPAPVSLLILDMRNLRKFEVNPSCKFYETEARDRVTATSQWQVSIAKTQAGGWRCCRVFRASKNGQNFVPADLSVWVPSNYHTGMNCQEGMWGCPHSHDSPATRDGTPVSRKDGKEQPSVLAFSSSPCRRLRPFPEEINHVERDGFCSQLPQHGSARGESWNVSSRASRYQ